MSGGLLLTPQSLLTLAIFISFNDQVTLLCFIDLEKSQEIATLRLRLFTLNKSSSNSNRQ